MAGGLLRYRNTSVLRKAVCQGASISHSIGRERVRRTYLREGRYGEKSCIAIPQGVADYPYFFRAGYHFL